MRCPCAEPDRAGIDQLVYKARPLTGQKHDRSVRSGIDDPAHRARSAPLGIAMSTSAACGWLSLTTSTASSPSAATPTSSNSRLSAIPQHRLHHRVIVGDHQARTSAALTRRRWSPTCPRGVLRLQPANGSRRDPHSYARLPLGLTPRRGPAIRTWPRRSAGLHLQPRSCIGAARAMASPARRPGGRPALPSKTAPLAPAGAVAPGSRWRLTGPPIPDRSSGSSWCQALDGASYEPKIGRAEPARP